MAEVRIDVFSDTHGSPEKLGAVQHGLKGIDDQGKRTDKALGGLWQQFAAGNLIANATQKAIGAVTDFMKDSFKAAIESENAQAALNSALASTGRTVAPLSAHFQKYASGLAAVTLYDDEAIQGAQALLLQLTNLDRNGIDEATKGALGLASVFKMDLQSAARAVAQGMEGNYIMLGRMIPAIRTAKTESEKHAAMMDGLARFYRRAQDETQTFGGSLSNLKKNWGEIQEEVGKAVLATEGMGDVIRGVSKAMSDFVTSGGLAQLLAALKRNSPILDSFMAGLKQWALVLELVSAKANKAKKEEEEHARAVQSLGTTYKGVLPVLDKIIPGFEMIRSILQKTDPIINETGRRTHALTAEELKAIEAKKKLAAAAQAVLDKVNPLAAAIRKLREDEKTLDAARKAGLITAQEHAFGVGALRVEYNNLVVPIASATDALLKFADAGGSKVIPALLKIQTTSQKVTFAISSSWAKSSQDWVNKNQNALNQVFSATSSFVGMIDGILQQSANNKMLALDNEYQARLEFIKNSLMSEEEKNKAIEGLDAEYSMKRRKTQADIARQGKATAIAAAIINVAQGVTKALAELPPPFNIALAAITAAAGAIQIALIRATPIPLKHGAIFRKPVFSPGGDYEAGEAGPEAIIPLRELPRIMREIMPASDRGGFGSNRPIVIQNRIILDGREMKTWTTKTVIQAGDLGKLGTVGKGFRQ